MADQTSGSRFESVLREALLAEVANLPLTVDTAEIFERVTTRRRHRVGSRLRRFIVGEPAARHPRLSLVVAAGASMVVLVVAALALGSYLNNSRSGIGTQPSPPVSTPPPMSTLSPSAAASVDLGIFEAVAGRIVYANSEGIWAVDPAAPADFNALVQLTSEADVPLGWSSDGTKLLFMRQGPSGGQLFVLHADGSETPVTEQSMSSGDATISPDGSRVVFHSGTGIAEGGGGCCARYGLYLVDADGGPAELILDARARDALVQEPTFSPDGTQIAYVEGAGDHSNSVWLMAADGSGAHQIVSNEGDRVAGGHVHGLQWSPAGDRIALGLGGAIYTFATDGSDFTKVITAGNTPYWSPDGTQIAFHRMVGGAAIADADGSNVRDLGFATNPGPWHPGAPTTTPTEIPTHDPALAPTMTTATDSGSPAEFTFRLKYAELHATHRGGWSQRYNTLSRGDVIGISAWSIDGIYADPCRWETSLVPLEFDGSWFEDFIGTLMQQPGRDATRGEPEFDFGDWTVAAKIELSVPADLDVETCDQAIYNAWTDINDPEPLSGNGNHEPGQTDLVYAVNIDQSAVIIDAWLRAGATAEDRAELEAMLAEIRLEL